MNPLPPRQHMPTGQSNSVSQMYHGVGKREINEALLGKTAFYLKPMKEGKPRKESVKTKFDRTEGNANNLLKKKYHAAVSEGYASLIGKIASKIGNEVVNSPNRQATLSFVGLDKKTTNFKFNIISPTADDIVVNCGTYPHVIEKMGNAATKTIAEVILKNLSKSSQQDPNDIFEDLDDFPAARKLIAILICETIRFQDDGACARMAMRLVIDLYNKSSSESDPLPFQQVFVGVGDEVPLAIFADHKKNRTKLGGKQRMIAQILGHSRQDIQIKKEDEELFEKDKKLLNSLLYEFISGDEDNAEGMEEDDYDSDFNDGYDNSDDSSSSEKTGTIRKSKSRNSKGERKEGYFKDKHSGLTPKRRKPYAKPNSGFKLDGLDNSKGSSNEEEAQHEFGENHTQNNDNDPMEPLSTINNNFGETNQEVKARFCHNCKLFYSIDSTKSDNKYLKTCPNCKQKVGKIKKSHLNWFINGISKYKKANKLPDVVEGYYIELGNLP